MEEDRQAVMKRRLVASHSPRTIVITFIASAFVLFHLQTTSALAPNALDTMPVGQWFEVANTKVQSVMYQYSSGTYFGNTTNLRFLDESGASYDSTRNQMIIWGGGHSDYAGNEIYAFNIGSLTWTRVNDPSPRLDTSGSIESSGYYPDASGSPDLQQPRSRHSYWYQVYVPVIDRYCSMGATFTFPNARSSGHVDCFDLTAKRWEQKQDALTFNGLATAIYDPSTRNVWVHGQQWSSTFGFLASWDPVTDTWTRRSNAPSGVKEKASPALDTQRHKLAFLGAGELRIFDLNQSGTLAPQLVTVTGDT